ARSREAPCRATGVSLSRFVQDAVRSALASAPSEQAPPFELVTFRGSGPKAGIDLDPSAELLAAEDVERHGHR
ncbi:MAG: hypothetical protein RIF41_07915, partial [Polyangiaceae bacterium]